MIPQLDYDRLSEQWTFGHPNRLLVWVHPGWDFITGMYNMPLWESYLEEAAKDANIGLLVAEGYGPDDIPKQREYNDRVRDMTERLSKTFSGRFASHKGLLKDTEEDHAWLMKQVGSEPIKLRNDERAGSILATIGKKVIRYGEADFFTISFEGMYRSMCVDWQRADFPCSSLWPKGYWNLERTFESVMSQR